MANEENTQRDPEMNPEQADAFREGEPKKGPKPAETFREGEPPIGSSPDEDAPAEHKSVEAAEPELTAQQWLSRNGWILALLACGVIFLYSRFGVGVLVNIAKVGVGLGFVIFIHELGHFLVAKWCGVKVEVFSIGFGPAIPGCRFQWGETAYKIAMFPLGGYVQMLGQVDLHEEDDGSEEDPRSYKNKAVWQRMAIISAGVIMNALLALVCYLVVFLGPGKDRMAGVVSAVDSGSPSFTKGIRSGVVVDEIGGVERPYFENLQREVLISRILDYSLTMTYHEPDQKPRHIEIKPRVDEGSKARIGVGAPLRLQLRESRFLPEGYETPVHLGSAASRAKPALKFSDIIIATTDPENPEKIKKLPIDPRVPKTDPNYGQKDYYAFLRRMQKLAGREVTVRVQREENGENKTVDIRIPVAYHRTLGAVMAMGEVTAVRLKSPAARAGIQQQDKSNNVKGDVIEMVHVEEADGTITRFTHQPEDVDKKIGRIASAVASALFSPLEVRPLLLQEHVVDPIRSHEVRLDPVRLPDQLKAWANRLARSHIPEKKWMVTLYVKRHNSPTKTAKEYTHTKLQLNWDKGWEYCQVDPMSPAAPMPIPELGLGYQVKTTVIWVDPSYKSKTAKTLRAGDIIEQIQLHQLTAGEGEEKNSKWYDVRDKTSENQPDKSNQWAQIAWLLNSPTIAKVSLKIKRNGDSEEIDLVPEEIKDWPQQDRGFILMPDERLQKADNLAGAFAMGVGETRDRLMDVFITLRGLFSGRVSADSFGGPLAIVTIAYRAASIDFWDFVFFIAFISINLAVVNFLPIPILDGGHMVFLTYELIRGKPASENVRVGATYVGLLLIVALFIFIMYLDITRIFFKGFP